MRRAGLLLLCFLAVGCGPDKRIVGTWDWGKDEIAFEPDGEFDSHEKATPRSLQMGGSWSTSGDVLTLQPTVIDPPEADPIHFRLSPDGKELIGSAKDGTMTNHRPEIP